MLSKDQKTNIEVEQAVDLLAQIFVDLIDSQLSINPNNKNEHN